MKVAINGAGIAGPTLAYWLQRSGHEPTLIEKAPHLRTGGYVVDFWGVGYSVAEQMGLLPQILAAGYAVQEVRVLDDRGRKVGGFSSDVFRRMTANRFTSLSRAELAAMIYRSLDNRVETIFGDSICAIEDCGSFVRVGFEGAAERNFDLVIGADGLHSAVRRLVFGPQSQFETPLGYRVAAFDVAGYRPRDELVYVTHNEPGRMIARFSLRGDHTMALFVFADSRMDSPEPRDTAEKKALLHRVFGNAKWESAQLLAAMQGVDDIYFDRVSQIRMAAWSKGRIMLLGDAACCVSFLAGEGAGLAMTEAYVLAGELSRAGRDYAAAVRGCEERLRPFIESKQKSARSFAAAFVPRTKQGVWFRNQMTKLLAIPALADLLVGRDVRDNFDLPDYPGLGNGAL